LDGPFPKLCPAVTLSHQDGRHSAVALLLKAALIQVSDATAFEPTLIITTTKKGASLPHQNVLKLAREANKYFCLALGEKEQILFSSVWFDPT
jgi:hypothetical protein